MKNTFEPVEIEIIVLEAADIITGSNSTGESGNED